ncbi:hypothetical protein F3N42_01435 [Marinihelvus fidelis]|uniref:Twin-arginine translocation signal domain-containing protein n=1 Tax=Marinihelvus fidelis TaxID=2613842 RepID=A0A5N0TEF4_9GAMM|nr:hypothetical protein [Marinihelvus fidelis]KAA9133051.1 hypothetical protein F3N42_01435 [Marinihelvus fidelis]
MADDKQTGSHSEDSEIDSSRRRFLRKASYTAPALVALGAAGHARRGSAQFNGPPSAPETNTSPADDESLLRDLEERDSD